MKGLITGTNSDIPMFGGNSSGNIPMSSAADELASTQPGGAGGQNGGAVFDDFMGAVKQGGIENPYALAAIASTGNAESGWSPENANRRWSDPSESGKAGTAGGVMSWRNDRLANLENYARMAGEDPANISAATQGKFFLQEDPQLIAKLNGAGSVEEAQSLMNNAWRFAGYNQPSREAANRLTSANSYLSQFQGVGGDQGAGPADYIAYANGGATRNRPLNDQLVSALGFLPEMGITAEVFSGGQPSAEEGGARTGSTRHDHGNAGDVFFKKDGRRLDWANPKDRPIFEEIVRRGKAAGITGFGAGDGYMQQGSMHLGFGEPAVWGAGGHGENAPDWLRNAYSAEGQQSGGAGTAAGAVTALAEGGQFPGAGQQGAIPQQFQGSQQLMGAQGGMMPALMGGEPASGQQVAQAQQTGQQVPMGGPTLQDLMGLAADPWLTNEQRGLVNTLLQQKMQEQQSSREEQRWRGRQDYEQQLRQQDPSYQLEQDYRRAQLDKMRRDANTEARQPLINAGGGAIYDPNEGKWIEGPRDDRANGAFRFSGNSVEAQSLNGLMDSRQLTPEQAQQLGAGKTITGPNGEILFLTPQGVFGSTADGQTQKLSGGSQGAATGNQQQGAASGGNYQITEPKVTIDERKAMGFADRMRQSGGIIDQNEKAGLNAKDQFIRGNDWIPDFAENWMVSNDFQKFDQARRDFINAQLRRESGAVISPEEFDNARQQYFPQPGDGEDVLKQKAANRRTVIDGMTRDAGPTYGAGGDPLAKARKAIAAGANREAVIQRLRENGIDTEGL